MIIRLDHLVHAVSDLEAAQAEAARYGLSFRAGGEHPRYHSANALAYAGLTYWELLAFRAAPPDDAPAFVRWAHAALQTDGPGLTGFGLGSDDLAGDVDALRAAGFRVSHPVQGTRTTPDGTILTWRIAEFLDWPSGAGTPPFLIQHDQDEAVRIEQLAGLGFDAARQTPRLVELAWPVPDPQAARQALARALGAVGTAHTPDLTAAGLVLETGAAPLTLRFVPTGERPAVRWLGARSGRFLGVMLSG